MKQFWLADWQTGMWSDRYWLMDYLICYLFTSWLSYFTPVGFICLLINLGAGEEVKISTTWVTVAYPWAMWDISLRDPAPNRQIQFCPDPLSLYSSPFHIPNQEGVWFSILHCWNSLPHLFTVQLRVTLNKCYHYCMIAHTLYCLDYLIGFLISL